MISDLRGHLLGFMATRMVSLSSTKAKKLSTHGQGGVGKTTMAIVIVNDPMVRGAFDRIGWVSIGQAPNIMEMQRTLFEQLTGEPMPVKDGATTQTQLEDLQAACKGKRFLVVLDDAWERVHEKQLNCIDPESPSKQLVTTRIRGLMEGCDEVSLNLLTPTESVDLLLRTGGVDEPDDEAREAAARIVKLCGQLPLYVSICGGVIHDYEGATDWQTELVDMLQLDRVGLIDDIAGSDGDTGERIVDASLNMLQDDDAAALFQSLALCPEDVPVSVPAAQLICEADDSNTSKVSAVSMRRWMKKLLDRNLLQGSITDGVHQHDIVRDIMRERVGDEDAMRAKQRAVVEAIIRATPESGWSSSGILYGGCAHVSTADVLSSYVTQTL